MLNHINPIRRTFGVSSSASLFLIALVCSAIAQERRQPELLGTWHYRNEDFGEFIYHKLELVKFEYLEKGRNGIVIARICSSDPFPLAFITSWGFAFNLPDYAAHLKIPAHKIYFATYSKCGRRSEQYWFVPDHAVLDYDQKLSSGHVEIRRWLGRHYDKPMSREAEAEFLTNTQEFIGALKSSDKAQGFLLRNSGVRQSKINTAFQHIRSAGIENGRFQIIRKSVYQSFYPEFMVITINQPAKQTK